MDWNRSVLNANCRAKRSSSFLRFGTVGPTPKCNPEDDYLEAFKRRMLHQPEAIQRQHEMKRVSELDEFLWLKSQIESVSWREPISHL